MQHANTPPIAPIPARVVPHPWEDLASYISRLAAEMGYRNPGWLLHPEEVDSAVRPFNLCLLRRKADYQFFERLLCLSESLRTYAAPLRPLPTSAGSISSNYLRRDSAAASHAIHLSDVFPSLLGDQSVLCMPC